MVLSKSYDIINCDDTSRLLYDFNRKEDSAFEYIYTLFYSDLRYYTSKLYANTEVEADDAINDAFLKILENQRANFKNIEHIKGHLYLTIKNAFLDYISHKKHIDKHAELQKRYGANSSMYDVDMIETEAISYIYQKINSLPSECAKVLRLHIEGWSVAEIANKLGKSENTIYHQRDKAISALKIGGSKQLLSIISIFLN